MSKKYPKAPKHGNIEEVFQDVFFVSGSVNMIPGVRLSRNMIIIREGSSLTLISALRLNEEGLRKLDSLGKVEHVIRLGDYHLDFRNGIDDPFYIDRYQANYWTMKGMNARNGLVNSNLMHPSSEFPISEASFFSYETSKRPEGLILLHRHGGILIAADSIQNMVPDRYFSSLAKLVVRMGGFFKPANVGPAWLKNCKPEKSDFVRVKQLNFSHLIPSHGKPIKNTAKEEISKTYNKLFGI
ncbi:MAG: hypothetical protein MI974_23805 [Chitinophagales bacterium]|nr:hypothetical protein [Chitinophagales bacterium]